MTEDTHTMGDKAGENVGIPEMSRLRPEHFHTGR